MSVLRSISSYSTFLPYFLFIALFFAWLPFSSYLDLSLSQLFYDPAGKAFSSYGLWTFAYEWAPKPAILVASVACIALLSSFFIISIEKYRPIALQLFLTLAIGSGVIVHLIFKEHWGRARPRQIELFGGSLPFTPFWQPNFTLSASEARKSFCCGHCTCGYYFFCCANVCRQRGFHRAGRLFWVGAFLLGSLLGLARIAQGGHFFSDVLFSALIMWGSAKLFSRLFEKKSV